MKSFKLNKKPKPSRGIFAEKYSDSFGTDDDTDKKLREEKIKKEKELGIEAAEREDFQSAIRHFKVAVYYDPKDYKIHEMMSQVYLGLEDYKEAMRSAITCTSLKSDYKYGHLCLARAYRELGEVLLSLESYKRVLELDGEDEEIRDEYNELNDVYMKYMESHENFIGRATVLHKETEDTYFDYNSNDNEVKDGKGISSSHSCHHHHHHPKECETIIEEELKAKKEKKSISERNNDKPKNFYYSIKGTYLNNKLTNNLGYSSEERQGFIPKWLKYKNVQYQDPNKDIEMEEEFESSDEPEDNC